MTSDIITGALIFGGIYIGIGTIAREVASDRLSKHCSEDWFDNEGYPFNQQIRIALLWPLYMIFRLLALTFYPIERNKQPTEYFTFNSAPKQMPDWTKES